MDKPATQRRRLLRLLVGGALAAPVAVLAGCAQGGGSTPRRPRGYGGSTSGEKSGGSGGRS